jgi:aromatic-L-amino-acid/L-tryptophan decarboxylase
MSTVCFRAHPRWAADADELALTALNQAWLARVNATGRALLSHTVLDGRYVLRLATGNLRTTDERLAATLTLLDDELTALRPA